MTGLPIAHSRVATSQPPRLLDRIRETALIHFGRTEPAARYAEWARRFIFFHAKRHPRDMWIPEIGQFLEHLAKSEKDPVAALEQAREALGFLYERVLHIPVGELPFPDPPRLLDRVRRALRLGHRRRRPPPRGPRVGGPARRRRPATGRADTSGRLPHLAA